MRETYPTLGDVDLANRIQLATWVRFLPSPSTDHESRVLDRILLRFDEVGGWSPEVSKRIGWER